MEPRHGRYLSGTIVLRTDGYRFIKQMNGQWISEHRLNAQRQMGRDLLEGERVYHKNGRRDDNTPSNLAVIRFNLEKFKRLPHSRVLFIPKLTAKREREAVAA